MQHLITDMTARDGGNADNAGAIISALDLWTSAHTTKSSAGRGKSSKLDLHGIKKLRELILELAVHGKLVPQDPTDEPASVLMERIAVEKERLIKEKKIKKQKTLPPVGKDEKPSELPAGWRWVRLLDLVVLENGDRSKNYPNKTMLVESGIPFVNAGHLQNGLVNKSEMTFISPERYDLLKAGKFRDGDILYCLRGSLGKTALVDGFECGAIASSLVIVRAIQAGMQEYLLDYFASPLAESMIKKYDNGTAQPNLSAADLAKFAVPMPPEKEYWRIVAKVNELMALCDQLEQQQSDSITAHQTLVETLLSTLTNSTTAEETAANWARIAEHFDTLFTTEHSIDQLKQTVLQLAVIGRLVPQNPADEPASALLACIADEKARLVKEKKIKKQKPLPPIGEDEKPFVLPDGWEWCRVWDVSHTITSGSRDWAKYYSQSGAKFVTMSNLSRGDYRLRLNSMRYVSPPEGGEGARTKLEAGDLLISITGDVGNLGLIPEKFGEAYINQHTCMLRLMPQCRSLYFANLMRSPWVKFQFDAPQRGIKNSFRLGDVGEMIIPLPPQAEFERIVEKVEQLMTLCEQLKNNIQQSQQTNLHLANAIVEQALEISPQDQAVVA